MNDIPTLETEREQRAVSAIMTRTDDNEKRALLAWLDEIIDIRNSGMRKRDKVRRVLSSFRHAGNLLSVIRMMRGLLWDERSKPFRLGLGLTAAAAVLMPAQATLAALGGAVTVPLWMVFGSGYAFALLLSRELRRKLSEVKDGEVIEAEYEVVENKTKF